jgi:hypothetical protein
VTCSLHAPLTHVIQGDFRLLMVGNQIDILTPGFYFGHNLCYKYSNGSCEFILDIYVSKTFQWHKEVFNPMNFDSFSKYSKVFWIPSPKMRAHLGVCGFIPSHSFAFLVVWMWLPGFTLSCHLSMPLALIVRSKLKSWHSHALSPIFWQTYV